MQAAEVPHLPKQIFSGKANHYEGDLHPPLAALPFALNRLLWFAQLKLLK